MVGIAEIALLVLNEVRICHKIGAKQKTTVNVTPTNSAGAFRLLEVCFGVVLAGELFAIIYCPPVTLTRLFENKNAAITTAVTNSKNVTTTSAAP